MMQAIIDKPDQPKVLAFIPARAGSKRIPKKNIIPLAGKPLIAWTIEAALGLKNTDVIVATDCPEMAEVAKHYGAWVPFLRSTESATDTASGYQALEEALAWLAQQGKQYDIICYLQPTSPLRTTQDIQGALEKLVHTEGAESVVSVAELEHPAQWNMQLPDDGNMQNFIEKQLPQLTQRSQDLAKSYRLNGAIYVIKVDAFQRQKTAYIAGTTFAYPMPAERSIDIDHLSDLKLAEFYLNQS